MSSITPTGIDGLSIEAEGGNYRIIAEDGMISAPLSGWIKGLTMLRKFMVPLILSLW